MKYNCLVCDTPAQSPPQGVSRWQSFNCPRCGRFEISEEGKWWIEDHQPNLNEGKRDYISFRIRQETERAESPIKITEEYLQRWLKNVDFPKPPEQANNLILWLGRQARHQDGFSGYLVKNQTELASIVGCNRNRDSVGFLVRYLNEQKLLDSDDTTRPTDSFGLRLSIPGWERFQELQTKVLDSRIAFMAMQFSDVNMDKVYLECFKPAVADAGFELRRLDERQGAGLIDDQLRVAIRTAKFVLADLSSANAGAYWEAGFAEGIGKPVIYLCDSAVWKHEDPKKRPHFDTNHLVTIVWSPDQLAEARSKLTATIRNTFPGDALMGNS